MGTTGPRRCRHQSQARRHRAEGRIQTALQRSSKRLPCGGVTSALSGIADAKMPTDRCRSASAISTPCTMLAVCCTPCRNAPLRRSPRPGLSFALRCKQPQGIAAGYTPTRTLRMLTCTHAWSRARRAQVNGPFHDQRSKEARLRPRTRPAVRTMPVDSMSRLTGTGWDRSRGARLKPRTLSAHVRYLMNDALHRPPSRSSDGSSNASKATSPFFPT